MHVRITELICRAYLCIPNVRLSSLTVTQPLFTDSLQMSLDDRLLNNHGFILDMGDGHLRPRKKSVK